MNLERVRATRTAEMDERGRVTFGCMGVCGRAYPHEEMKVADGAAYCASCYPATLPASQVKAPHVLGPKPDWRKR